MKKLIRKLSIVIIFFISSLSKPMYAQNWDKMNNAASLLMLYTEGKYAACARAVERMYTNGMNNTEEDALCLLIGSASYISLGNESRVRTFYDASMAIPRVLPSEYSHMNDNSLGEDEKRLLLLKYLSETEVFQQTSFISRNIAQYLKANTDGLSSSFAKEFHDIAYNNRHLLRASLDPQDVHQLCAIYRTECNFFTIDRYHEIPDIIVPELLSLSSTSNHFLDNWAIWSVFETILPYYSLLTSIQGNQKYKLPFADFLIKLKELKLLASNRDASTHWKGDDVSWKGIARHLMDNESAIVTFNPEYINALIPSSELMGLLIIHSYPTIPEICYVPAKQASEISKYLDNNPHCEIVYYSPGDDVLNYDWAYTDERIHMCFSVYESIINQGNSNKSYTGGDVLLFANIDYGTSSERFNLAPLHSGKNLISFTKEVFGENLHYLEGRRVNKINFFSITKDVDIFHISTHGLDLGDLQYNSNSLPSIIIEDNDKKSFGLALSSYNIDPTTCYIDGKTIKNLDLNNLGLVFIDACASSRSKNTLFNSFSLAKAFYHAGAYNIISYIDAINENIAERFAILFYQELKENRNISYHKAFYHAKRQTISEYAQRLPKDELGRPQLGITIWE